MKSRILSLAAIAGMLAATGCSGGGAGSAPSGLTPTTKTPVGGTTTTTTVAGRSSFSFSFLMPATALLGTTSTGRHTAYISPGSSGIQVLLSDGTANGTFAIGTAAQPLPVSLNQPPNTPVTPGAYGTNATTPASTFLIGTAQLAAAYTPPAVAPANTPPNSVTINTLPGSATVLPPTGQPFTIQTGLNTVNMVVNSFTGTLASGLFINANQVGPGPGAVTYPVGSTISFGNNPSITGSTFSYTVAGAGAAGPSTTGYYQVVITFNNMRGGIRYQVGVALTDLNTPGFPILSEGQTALSPLGGVPLFGVFAFPSLTLNPVVVGVFMPPVQPVTAAQTVASGAPAGSFETTIFLTDARGFVIPNQTNVVVDNAPIFTITTPGGLTLGSFNGYTTTSTQTANTGTPTTNTYLAVPGQSLTVNAGAAASATNYANIFGTLFSNPQTPSAAQPGTLNLTGVAATNTGGVGNPLNLACNAAGPSNGISVSRVTVPPTNLTPTINGYNYVPGTNVPVAAATVLAVGISSSFPIAGSTLGINCNPSLSVPIN